MFIPVMANLFESPWGLLIILLLAFLFFGHKLPQIARGLGSSVSEFKKGIKEGEDEAKKDGETPDKTEEKKDVEKK
ncbi:MAG TPA: twin-arginine translocase TatA/TatE family subunit [Planctomycetota bacterium]|nr:twin-arginine translocase TatA/TatE family subunit [Planctomycetota bacterium]